MVPALPFEIIDDILILLATYANDPKQAFYVATSLRRRRTQTRLVRDVISMDQASAWGCLVALDLHAQCIRTKYRVKEAPAQRSAKQKEIKPEYDYYTAASINNASANGHVHVLHWWKSSGLNLICTHDAMNDACKNGHVAVLDWWFSSGLKFRYTVQGIESASENGHVDVLEWWKTHQMEINSFIYIDAPSERGHVKVLEWWKESGLKFYFTSEAMDLASRNGHVDVLEWWKTSGLDIKWSTYAMDAASQSGHVNVLEWWKTSGLSLKWSEKSMDFASEEGHVEVLQWWKSSGLPLKWSKRATECARQNGHGPVLEWWKASGLDQNGWKVNGLDLCAGFGALNLASSSANASEQNLSARPGQVNLVNLKGAFAAVNLASDSASNLVNFQRATVTKRGQSRSAWSERKSGPHPLGQPPSYGDQTEGDIEIPSVSQTPASSSSTIFGASAEFKFQPPPLTGLQLQPSGTSLLSSSSSVFTPFAFPPPPPRSWPRPPPPLSRGLDALAPNHTPSPTTLPPPPNHTPSPTTLPPPPNTLPPPPSLSPLRPPPPSMLPPPPPPPPSFNSLFHSLGPPPGMTPLPVPSTPKYTPPRLEQ